jgi:phage terminase large subunit
MIAWNWGEKPNPKLIKFCFSKAKYSVCAGGIRSGKTTAACRRAIFLSLAFPGNRGIIARHQATQLKISTIQIFEKELAKANEGKIIGGFIKSWNRVEKILTFVNGSEIYFRHLDKPETIQGSEWGFIYIDEAHEVPEETYGQLKPRLTFWSDQEAELFMIDPKRKELQRQFLGFNAKPKPYLFITQNPHPGWTKKEFKEDVHGQYELTEITTRENEEFLGKGYADDLKKTMPEDWYNRFVEGSWDVAGGQVYKEFSTAIHVIDAFDIPAHWKRVICMDFGWNNPTAVLWMAIDDHGNIFVYDEHYQSRVLPSQHAIAIKAKSGDSGRVVIWADPSGNNNSVSGRGSLFEEYRQHGIICQAADNDVATGIMRVSEYLHVDPDHVHPVKGSLGSPRFFFLRDRAPNAVQEILTYEWDSLPEGREGNDPERPKKHNDHALDALRYGVMTRPKPSELPKVEPTWDELKSARQKEADEFWAKSAFNGQLEGEE